MANDPLNATPQEGNLHPFTYASCASIEPQLLESMDQRLPPDQNHALEAHLEQCAQCRELLALWRPIDAELTNSLARPKLSVEFASRLWHRIETLSASEGWAERDQRKHQIEADLGKNWSQYRAHFLRTGVLYLLDFLGYGMAFAIAAYLFSGFALHGLVPAAAKAAATMNPSNISLFAAGSVLIVVISLSLFAKKQMTSFYTD